MTGLWVWLADRQLLKTFGWCQVTPLCVSFGDTVWTHSGNKNFVCDLMTASTHQRTRGTKTWMWIITSINLKLLLSLASEKSLLSQLDPRSIYFPSTCHLTLNSLITQHAIGWPAFWTCWLEQLSDPRQSQAINHLYNAMQMRNVLNWMMMVNIIFIKDSRTLKFISGKRKCCYVTTGFIQFHVSVLSALPQKRTVYLIPVQWDQSRS